MGIHVLLYIVLWLVCIVFVAVVLWRAMKAHEAIARHLESIAQSLAARNQRGP
jgi:hypothetical protein